MYLLLSCYGSTISAFKISVKSFSWFVQNGMLVFIQMSFISWTPNLEHIAGFWITKPLSAHFICLSRVCLDGVARQIEDNLNWYLVIDNFLSFILLLFWTSLQWIHRYIYVGLCYTQLVEHFFQSLVNTSGMTLHIRQVIIPKFSCACVIDVHVWQYIHFKVTFCWRRQLKHYSSFRLYLFF